jgi:hypothetical protein
MTGSGGRAKGVWDGGEGVVVEVQVVEAGEGCEETRVKGGEGVVVEVQHCEAGEGCEETRVKGGEGVAGEVQLSEVGEGREEIRGESGKTSVVGVSKLSDALIFASDPATATDVRGADLAPKIPLDALGCCDLA